MNPLDSPSWIFSSLFIVVPSILICLALLWVVRKCISVEELKANHDVAGFTLGIVGVLYSVILGFTVVNVQSRSNEVLQTIHTEAVSIANLYRDASFFPPSGRDAIRSALRTYVQYVIEKEWENPNNRKINIQAHKIMEKIWNSYYWVEIPDEKTALWYEESISKLDAFMNARLSRQFNSWEHLGSMMWTILILGGIITICFMYFFGLERLHAQMMMTALLAGYISLMLYLVFCLDNVFKGPQGITPAAFEQIVTLFDYWDGSSH
ncbi:MAG: DUF4239 domain-containing protein [Chlamydiales bacterium]